MGSLNNAITFSIEGNYDITGYILTLDSTWMILLQYWKTPKATSIILEGMNKGLFTQFKRNAIVYI